MMYPKITPKGTPNINYVNQIVFLFSSANKSTHTGRYIQKNTYKFMSEMKFLLRKTQQIISMQKEHKSCQSK